MSERGTVTVMLSPRNVCTTGRGRSSGMPSTSGRFSNDRRQRSILPARASASASARPAETNRRNAAPETGLSGTRPVATIAR
jgi:hypothetical protein